MEHSFLKIYKIKKIIKIWPLFEWLSISGALDEEGHAHTGDYVKSYIEITIEFVNTRGGERH